MSSTTTTTTTTYYNECFVTEYHESLERDNSSRTEPQLTCVYHFDKTSTLPAQLTKTISGKKSDSVIYRRFCKFARAKIPARFCHRPLNSIRPPS